jgi:hypothetical protein
MPNYLLTGKLGSGKSLCGVGRIQEYLGRRRPVATNLDLNMEVLCGSNNKSTVYRLPDKPRLADLDALGYAYPKEEPYDETKFGCLMLDELGTWMNTRNYRDPERFAVINWFLHARKLRWDVYMIVQHEEMIDKQIRDALGEHIIVCQRMDRIKVFKLFRLPKVHQAKTYYGSSKDLIVDIEYYKAKDLYAAYDTGQVFSSQEEVLNGKVVDMRAPYTMLSAWHLKGRYEQLASEKSIKFFSLPYKFFLYSCLKLASLFDPKSKSYLDWAMRNIKIVCEENDAALTV